MEMDLYKNIQGAICLQKMIEDQIKKSIDLYRCGVNNTIYSAFLLNDCNNYVLGLNNGLVLTFSDYKDEKVKFKISAADKTIIIGKIESLFNNPTFTYEKKLCYNDRMEIADLELVQAKWEMVHKLISPDNIL